jgi:hypothetical protein
MASRVRILSIFVFLASLAATFAALAGVARLVPALPLKAGKPAQSEPAP